MCGQCVPVTAETLLYLYMNFMYVPASSRPAPVLTFSNRFCGYDRDRVTQTKDHHGKLERGNKLSVTEKDNSVNSTKREWRLAVITDCLGPTCRASSPDHDAIFTALRADEQRSQETLDASCVSFGSILGIG